MFKKARHFAILSLIGSLFILAVKILAYLLTDSVSLYSDAAESIVNPIAALIAVWAISRAAMPEDADYSFGRSKAEYISSAFEGILILIAAFTIFYSAFYRIIEPREISRLDTGLMLSVLATLLNGAIAYTLFRAGKKLRSVALVADAHHLMTDVYTSIGIVFGLILVRLTGFYILDPLIAIVVALNILRISYRLLKEAHDGLLDRALPADELKDIHEILNTYRADGIDFHALRTRTAGTRSFVSVHVLVPGHWSVQHGHSICDRIEIEVSQKLQGCTVTTHLEPIEDPQSWADTRLDR